VSLYRLPPGQRRPGGGLGPRPDGPLFYTSEAVFPGMTDVQSATLDDPDALPLQVQIQTAERIGWMETAHRLPAFERYPGAPGD